VADQIFCRGCGRSLDEDSSLPAPERPPCPDCGSLVREYHASSHLQLSVNVRTSGDVVAHAPTATATASALAPTVSIEEAVSAGAFTRTVIWSKTPGEAWFGEVRDASGRLVGVEVGFNAVDTLVVLADHLLPPGV
jgi:hypothetical protein